MFFLCACGKMIYYLDEDCPYCGRRIDFEDDSAIKPDLMEKFGERQMRLFEC